MRSTVLLAGFLFALIASALLFAPRNHARAAATWVEVRAPFNGQWDKFGGAPPDTHSVGLWGGDWATDYYQTPNATGYWYPYSSSGSSVSTSVALVGNTCAAGSWAYAGIKYAFAVTNDSGSLGWFQWAHVYPSGSGFSQNQSIGFGEFIGYTYNWGYTSGCYEVFNDSGVHWHIVGFNYSAYSCYAPHSTNASLTAQSSLLGAVGSNATAEGQSCW